MKLNIYIIFILQLTSNQLLCQIDNDTLINRLKSSFDLYENERTSEIIKFNSDTIVIVGYFSEEQYGTKHNCTYRTTDGGELWSLIKFDGDAWIYTSYFNNEGKIWMGGSDSCIYYSSNYGESWLKKISPFKDAGRVYSIFMIDSLYGVTGGLSNELSITNNNWISFASIPTPLDQGKYKITPNSSRNEIRKVQIIDSLILIDQNEHIYYSQLSPIVWKEFNFPVLSFDVRDSLIEIETLGDQGFLLDSELNLVKKIEYEDSNLSFARDSIQKHSIDLDDFLNKGISIVRVTTIDVIPAKRSGLHYSATTKSTKFQYDNDNRIFKLRKRKTFDVERTNFDESSIKLILNNSSLNAYSNISNLTYQIQNVDKIKYDDYLQEQINYFKKRELYGGNPSYFINPNDKIFSTSVKSFDILSDKNILAKIFNENEIAFYQYLLSQYREAIIVEIENSKGEILRIDSNYSQYFGLPWKISLNQESTISYDPRISLFLRSIIPKKCDYYQKLFASELLFEYIRWNIIENIKFE